MPGGAKGGAGGAASPSFPLLGAMGASLPCTLAPTYASWLVWGAWCGPCRTAADLRRNTQGSNLFTVRRPKHGAGTCLCLAVQSKAQARCRCLCLAYQNKAKLVEQVAVAQPRSVLTTWQARNRGAAGQEAGGMLVDSRVGLQRGQCLAGRHRVGC